MEIELALVSPIIVICNSMYCIFITRVVSMATNRSTLRLLQSSADLGVHCLEEQVYQDRADYWMDACHFCSLYQRVRKKYP